MGTGPCLIQDFKSSFCFLTPGGVMLQFWMRKELNSQRSGRSCFLGVWKELNGDGCSCLVNLGRLLVIELLLLVVLLAGGENGDAFLL
jgi:hypothetical protein